MEREKDHRSNTNGHGQWELNYGNPLDNQNHKWKGTVSSSILIEDAEYLEIEGLELTNDRESSTDTRKRIKSIMMQMQWTEPVLPELQKIMEL